METYDVFVAYSDADRDLAREQVILPLRNAGLRIVTRSDGRYGASVLSNIEEAVRLSRHTLPVMTMNYVNDPFCELLDTLAMHLDPATQESKLIPLFFEPIKQLQENIRGRSLLLISIRGGIDMSDYKESAEAMKKLKEQLLGDLKIECEESARSVQLGAATLRWFLDTPEVRTQVERFSDLYQRTCGQINMLTKDKDLHEEFHSAQDAFNVLVDRQQELIEQISESLSDRDPALLRSWIGLGRAFDHLQARLVAVKSRARDYSAPGSVPAWVFILGNHEGYVEKGIKRKRIEAVKSGIEGIDRVLSSEPTKLNGGLTSKAQLLRFNDLIEIQTEILKQLQAKNFRVEIRQRIEVSLAGVEALRTIDKNLGRLISNHDALQSCENEVQILDHDLYPEAPDVQQIWSCIAEPLRQLRPARWMEDLKLEEKMSGLEDALQGFDEDVDDPGVAERILLEFQKLRPAIGVGFSRTDWDLKADCGHMVSKLSLSLAAGSP